jgi:hypothetical protein
VSVPKLDKLPEPENLGTLKAEVHRQAAPGGGPGSRPFPTRIPEALRLAAPAGKPPP